MESLIDDDDPFYWDTDTLCRKLCYTAAPWTQDVMSLEANLREHLVDGETLLTYELAFSRDKLMECLEVRAARHQMKLAMEIVNLQCKSRAFRAKKLELSGIQHTIDADVDKKLLLQEQDIKARQNIDMREGNRDTSVSTVSVATRPAEADAGGEGEGEPVAKRRRLSPTLIANIPLKSAEAVRLASESNKFAVPIQTNGEATSNRRDAHTAYLGNIAITKQEILDSRHQMEQDDDSDDEFQMIAPRNFFIPPGKRKVVHNILKKHLQKNSKKAIILQNGGKLDNMTAFDSEDEIIGLSDSSDGPDEQTLREIAEEEADNAALAAKSAKKSQIPEDRVRDIINEAIRDISTKWEATKKQKYERKAYKLWTYAQKWGQRRQKGVEAERMVNSYDVRIQTIVDKFTTTEWKREAELRTQTKSLEQNVEDKLYHSWLVSLYMSRSKPEKPQSVPKEKVTLEKPRPDAIPSDEELLLSTDEEDFVVPDEAAAEDTSLPPTKTNQLPSTAVQGRASNAATSEPVGSGEDGVDFVDLTTTPGREMSATQDSIVAIPSEPFADKFSSDELAAIGKTPAKVWTMRKDRWRLTISLLWSLKFYRRKAVLEMLQRPNNDAVWEATIEQLLTDAKRDEDQPDGAAMSVAVDVAVIFLSFLKCKYQKERRVTPVSDKDKDRFTQSGRTLFPGFCNFVTSIAPGFPDEGQIYRDDMFDDEIDDLEGDHDMETIASSEKPAKSRKPVKEIVRDRDALDLREREKRRIEEQEQRRDNLRSALAATAVMSGDKSRLIINESKQDAQGFVYINEYIGNRIKDHQVDGVRFLWNQIVVESSIRQGCLLAHTMGLGKTMQTITFLVAVSEAACSQDPSVRDQVPEDLRECRTLILCPAGLVQNWMDELLIWAPRGIFRHIYKVEATQKQGVRLSTIEDWGKNGGILIMGYTMFKTNFLNGQVQRIDDAMDTILTDRANIVVADEAHVLKNPHAKISYLSSKFRAKARIALTGSPLANNVEEYYSMINWVAPNFLGPLQEFRQIYAMPIHNGLWNDSTLYDKRKALKLLQALQDTVAPKVNRATIKTCLREGLPPKFEFVLSVRPTPKQREVYHLFINGVNSHNANSKSMEQGKVFNILNYLALICAHPTCFRTRLEEISRLEKAGKDTGSFPMSIHRHATFLTDEPRLEGEEFSHKVELLTAILDECKRMKDKVLVFSQSLPTIDYLMGLYNRQGRRISRLDGSTPISKRQDMIKDFNTGQEEVYLISTTAGGVGLNIHGANRVVIFDFKWNPVNDQQAVGRAYRIGQQKPVFVYKFVLAGTFEDDLQNKAVFKMQLASRIVDKKNPVSWSKQLRGLLHPIREVPSKDLSPFEGKDVVLDKLICCGKGDKIASIVSTDTFEEEDENWRLTAEERKEAENMVERNRLRISDPQAYERIMEREKLAAVSTQHQHGSFLPPGLPLLASQQDSIWNNSSPRPHLPSSGTPVSVASTRSGTSSPITLSANETPVPLPSRPPIPAPPTVSNLAVPAPMKGTNTYFASEKSRDEAAPPEDAREVPKAPGSAEKTNPQAPKLSFGPFNKPSGKGTSGKGKFEEKFTECLQAQHHDLPTSVQEQSPEEFAKGIANQVETIRQEREFGFLPDNARWNLLCELLQNNRVVLAAAAGHLTAMFLAVAEENMLRDRVQAISKIPEEVFKSRMRQRGAEKDPEVWEAQQLQLLATQQQEDE